MLPKLQAYVTDLVGDEGINSRNFGKAVRHPFYQSFGEVFNLFNVANLDGYGVNLLESSTFGQPNRRATQVFGSGGPRAFQVGGRINF